MRKDRHNPTLLYYRILAFFAQTEKMNRHRMFFLKNTRFFAIFCYTISILQERSNFMNKGFTLIELLVVVLIIGILTGVAIPQYEKAIKKSRTTEAVVTSKAILDAANIYSTTFRQCPTSLDDLDVKVNYSSKNWAFELADRGARNCGVFITSTSGDVQVSRFLIKNPSVEGLPSGVSSGAEYWQCSSGDCATFFKNIGLKKKGSYYQ